jgi:hypothetical protein
MVADLISDGITHPSAPQARDRLPTFYLRGGW